MEKSDLKKIHELVAQKNELEKKIQKLYSKHYKKYEHEKELVKDDNPYSRLFALKKMGIVENFEDFSKKGIIVVGVGGVGSVLCEMLVRMGIGKLIIYDYDVVELANMNRLFYTPDQVGFSKVEAAKMTLEKINADVVITPHHCNITENEHYEKFLENIDKGGLDGSRIDLVISCVDNYSARMTINTACNEKRQPWFESGVSEDALSCHYQIMLPGETACFACIPPLAFIEKNEEKIKREGVCAASLPTTMGITAGLLAHTAMKFLLEFEDIHYYLQYNARNEFFCPNLFEPSPDCFDKKCIQNQLFVKDNHINNIQRRKLVIDEKKKHVKLDKVEVDVEKWGIEIIDDSEAHKNEVFIKKEDIDKVDLSDLMNMLKNTKN